MAEVVGDGAVRRAFPFPRADVLVVGLAVAAIGYLALVPLGFLLWETFVDDGRPTLAAFRHAYGTYGLAEMVLTSFWFALGSTVIGVVTGTALAYLLARTDVPAKSFLFALALVPIAVPGVLYAIAWVFLASPRSGLLNGLLEPLVGPEALDVFTLGGMIVVEGLHLAPLAFLLMLAAMRSLDPALEESALVSGARVSTVVRRVTLPLAKPALSASVLVLAVRALEAFEVPALIGMPNGTWVFTSRIWRALGEYPPDFPRAGAYALSLLALTALGVLLHAWIVGRPRSYQTVTGKGFRPRPLPLGRWRWPALAFVAVYFLLAAGLPMLALLYVSGQPFYSGLSLDALRSLHLGNYAEVLTDERTLTAAKNSLVLALGAATVVVLVTALASWLVVRTQARGRRAVDALAFLPIAVPGLVLGFALLVVYVRLPLPVYGTLWILLIAYFTRFMPYGMRSASISMTQIGRELEESARTSGAGWWTTFRRVLVPLLLPGLAAGWIYILIVALRELSSSIVLYSPGDEVLAIEIWSQYENGRFGEVAALGVLLVATLSVLLLVAYRLGARLGVREA